MATAVARVYHRILERLQDEIGCTQAIAESSAGVTQYETSDNSSNRLRKRYLARQREVNSFQVRESSEDRLFQGPIVRTVMVGRLPADGEKPNLVPIDFYPLPEDSERKIAEIPFMLIPNFHNYWGASQLERRWRRLLLENQENKTLEGEYFIYWNEDTELSGNEHIKSLVNINTAGVARKFWYGDVFLVRFHEDETTFAINLYDASWAIVDFAGLRTVFQDMWQSSFLEIKAETNQYLATEQEKLHADEEILFARMSPLERQILSRMPQSTLTMLAMLGCDDGAMLNTSIEPCSDDPTKVRISQSHRNTALDSMHWQGFSSGDV
ncbi:MAG: hypothetical protein M1820_006264 [Bogoriella megaspora]|nr:MAG: hypothetical protein M1820_006264 [Bogoriella megaspora]